MMIGEGIKDIDFKVPNDAYDTGKYEPIFNSYLIAIVRDSKGNIVQIHKQRSHTYTSNFIGLILPATWFAINNSSYTLTNTAGGTCSYAPNTSCTAVDIGYPYSVNNAFTYLVTIQVGSGQQTNTSNPLTLAAPIANGSGTGQLVYGSISVPSSVIVSGSSAYFYVSQTYTNQSGSTITITEVGLLLQLTLANPNSNSSRNCGQLLVWYDVLSSALSIPNGGTATLYYTFTVNP
jgi:hypothetical protein